MFTFEKELERFFERDEWSEKSLRRLPALFQVELAFIVERIEFEQVIEGQRLSKPKYVQQLAVQRLLQHYSKVLPAICDFYQNLLPDFVDSLSKLKMTESATQVVLASLHSHWKLPRWFEEFTQLVDRYHEYGRYTEEQYKLPEINTVEMTQQLASARDDAITLLGSGTMVGHISKQNQKNKCRVNFGKTTFDLPKQGLTVLK